MSKKKKIGLVLSGGGAGGFAYLGEVKALHEKGIYPENPDQYELLEFKKAREVFDAGYNFTKKMKIHI